VVTCLLLWSNPEIAEISLSCAHAETNGGIPQVDGECTRFTRVSYRAKSHNFSSLLPTSCC
jgi:hypothetical protein